MSGKLTVAEVKPWDFGMSLRVVDVREDGGYVALQIVRRRAHEDDPEKVRDSVLLDSNAVTELIDALTAWRDRS